MPRVPALLILLFAAFAAARDVSHYDLGRRQLALDGFDPVSYFDRTLKGPVEGRDGFEYFHQGIRYRFASQKNWRRFKDDPQRYEPAYGGWCAWSLAKGIKVKAQPRSYRVKDGRLFLFSAGARTLWLKREASLIRKADREWAKLFSPFGIPAETLLPEKDYYAELAESCSRKGGGSCCMTSVRRMQEGGFREASDAPGTPPCPEKMSVDMLKCEGSLRWCANPPAE